MTNSPKDHALAKLSQIADHGYTVLTSGSDGGTRVLASNHSSNWTNATFATWSEAKDSAMLWMQETVGTISTAELDSSPFTQAVAEHGTTTLVSDLFAGSRLGLVLSHSKEALEEADIKEARAAALMIQLADQDDGEHGITAKELIYLEQVSTGASDDEIAADLQLSLRAVKERKRKAIDDLHAQNIGHAVGIAKRAKLI